MEKTSEVSKTSEVCFYTSILTGFSRNPASACMNWAAYPEGYDVGSVADAMVNGDGRFHAPAQLFHRFSLFMKFTFDKSQYIFQIRFLRRLDILL